MKSILASHCMAGYTAPVPSPVWAACCQDHPSLLTICSAQPCTLGTRLKVQVSMGVVWGYTYKASLCLFAACNSSKMRCQSRVNVPSATSTSTNPSTIQTFGPWTLSTSCRAHGQPHCKLMDAVYVIVAIKPWGYQTRRCFSQWFSSFEA